MFVLEFNFKVGKAREEMEARQLENDVEFDQEAVEQEIVNKKNNHDWNSFIEQKNEMDNRNDNVKKFLFY